MHQDRIQIKNIYGYLQTTDTGDEIVYLLKVNQLRRWINGGILFNDIPELIDKPTSTDTSIKR